MGRVDGCMTGGPPSDVSWLAREGFTKGVRFSGRVRGGKAPHLVVESYATG